MNQTQNTETIASWSKDWWGYMLLRLGLLRWLVNTLEDTLAVTGRFLLLVFLIYCGGKAGFLLSNPDYVFPAWLEMLMFVLQLAGLEGAIPGLARQADVLREKGDEVGAKKLDKVMLSARTMTVLSILEGALHALHTPYLQYFSAILLVVRGVVITNFLIALAKMETKSPRIVSKEVFEKEQTQQQKDDTQSLQIVELKEQLQKTSQEKQALSNFQLFLQKQSDIIDTRLQEIENATVGKLSVLVSEIENLKGFQDQLRAFQIQQLEQIESGFQEFLAESLSPVVERLQSHDEHLSILPAITEQIGQLEEATQYQLRTVTEEFTQVRVTLEQHTMELPRLAEKLASVNIPSQQKPKSITRGKSPLQIAAPKKTQPANNGKWAKEEKEQFVFECLQEDSEMSISAIQLRASERGQDLSIGSISGYRKAFQSRVVESDFEGPDTGEFESVVIVNEGISA